MVLQLGCLGYVTGKLLTWVAFLSREYDAPLAVYLEDPESTSPVRQCFGALHRPRPVTAARPNLREIDCMPCMHA